jgi:predicted  nucleic acid-binding Zn-ribbon protein
MPQKEFEMLVSLQDIDLMIEEVNDVQSLGFSVSGIDKLKKAREDVAAKITKSTLSRYERLRAKLKRAIVPVKDDICLGCFRRQPTARAVEAREDVKIITCEGCGRMLYWLE